MIDPTFCQTITLYNHYSDDGGKTQHKWLRTVLDNCYFGVVSAAKSGNLSKDGSDSFVCRIPQTPKFKFLYQGVEGTFTLAPGDIIVRGGVADEISDTNGNRPADILHKYKGNAFTIQSVSTNTSLPYAQHYRTSGV